jgi:hypothetical protein
VYDSLNVPVASRTIEIRDINVEFQNTGRDMETLRQWASVTDGLAVKVEDCADANDLVKQIKRKIEEVRQGKRTRHPLGLNFCVFAIALGLFGRRMVTAQALGVGVRLKNADTNRYENKFVLPLLRPGHSALRRHGARMVSQRPVFRRKTSDLLHGPHQIHANDGNDCGGVGQDLMKLVSRASTLKIQEEKKVKIADPELFETPFVFMNGHNDFVLTEIELENLRKYFGHGGFFFASGCCTNPNFPKAWRREFSRIFTGEKVKAIGYDHFNLPFILQNRASPLP